MSTLTLRPSRLHALLWLILGWLALALGVLGIILPGLPGTMFILAAAFCFAKGSPRCHQALLNHSLTGPMIRSWQEHRAMPRRAKKLAYSMLVVAWAIGMLVFHGWQYRVGYTLIMLAVSAGLARIPVLEEVLRRQQQ
ncbi:hypothetical protein WH50_25065 [Pokkaliibacter plantistimulans]|uniref:Inner membrane protein n=2 Tax=Pseudomonadota TaxID=1224 RepID=A0ABX5LPT9_9GAMM|nr:MULTISPECIES: YbaN family protein [Pokkaliibacter]MDH2433936.1 YbaN family protein [Pokkaliibacter sp. MBI-7]PPC76831.1 hypothetical protein C4K68_13425 [Pokkaliibacter plantistimulans]PXF28674.1 hypothetical protein WH50_25065 [Pokkaliibacter plantistimulans]